MLVLAYINTLPSGHAEHLPSSQPNGTNHVCQKLKISPRPQGVLGAKSVLSTQMTGVQSTSPPENLKPQ